MAAEAASVAAKAAATAAAEAVEEAREVADHSVHTQEYAQGQSQAQSQAQAQTRPSPAPASSKSGNTLTAIGQSGRASQSAAAEGISAAPSDGGELMNALRSEAAAAGATKAEDLARGSRALRDYPSAMSVGQWTTNTPQPEALAALYAACSEPAGGARLE